MLRRDPTRIELKIDDLDEYETFKKEKEIEQRKQLNLQKAMSESPTTSAATEGFGVGGRPRLTLEEINKRIGYNPKPLLEPSHLPKH